ncbi:hypothetical protein N7504_009829 [Penicillium tannophilum]|nr:hypothetical protein N7504_009829 [Penicillium tannophilum]
MAIARGDASCSWSPKEHKTGHNQLSAYGGPSERSCTRRQQQKYGEEKHKEKKRSGSSIAFTQKRKRIGTCEKVV